MTDGRSPAPLLTDLTSAQVTDAVRGRTVVWPVGAIEQHGPHLPLSVDLILAEGFAEGIARELDAFVLPAQAVGARSLPQSGGGLHFPGTVYVAGDTLVRFLRETLSALAALPMGRLVVVNGHYENEPFLFEALDQVREQGLFDGAEVFAFSWWSLVRDTWAATEIPAFPGWHAEHAGVTETSLMLHLRPDLVTDERPDHDDPPRAGIYLHPVDVGQTTHRGVLSSTSGSSAGLGERLLRHVVDEATALVRDGSGLLFAQSRPDRHPDRSPGRRPDRASDHRPDPRPDRSPDRSADRAPEPGGAGPGADLRAPDHRPDAQRRTAVHAEGNQQ
ncbi:MULTISPECIES: creatininase family protein [Streptomyces]|uniref:Creatininase family protein n=1 Tax=Streptomyces doudnae TaxID=3075536 RepID=A0ABD5EIH5_9ACTN|nr:MULTISPECIES: creatininase family protein [unclassified Streptomyces]MDT0434468.1 creatininase family protein [Streptomyces sp. DSM 41981]MYQ69014.1 creatininase family protein [Streptomyces sp. SID4950]SCE50734.1 creatinine amidohydrolase [Streptomyces sp. SolWspMP-5a-2]